MGSGGRKNRRPSQLGKRRRGPEGERLVQFLEEPFVRFPADGDPAVGEDGLVAALEEGQEVAQPPPEAKTGFMTRLGQELEGRPERKPERRLPLVSVAALVLFA